MEVGDSTYLGSTSAELADLVAQDGDFDFSALPVGRVRSLYEAGRWWERGEMPGVARPRQQVLCGAVDYFMYARDPSRGDGAERPHVCFVPEHYSGGALVRHFLESPAGLARAPGELFTRANVYSAVYGLRLDLLNGVPAALVGHRGMRWFMVGGRGDSHLVSGEKFRDTSVLERYGIRGVRERSCEPRSLDFDEMGRALFNLLGYSGALGFNPLRLLPSMRVPSSWRECYRGGRVVSSFLVADWGTLEHLRGVGK